MDSLAKKFLEEDGANKDLYVQGIIFKNDGFLDVLNKIKKTALDKLRKQIGGK